MSQPAPRPGLAPAMHTPVRRTATVPVKSNSVPLPLKASADRHLSLGSYSARAPAERPAEITLGRRQSSIRALADAMLSASPTASFLPALKTREPEEKPTIKPSLLPPVPSAALAPAPAPPPPTATRRGSVRAVGGGMPPIQPARHRSRTVGCVDDIASCCTRPATSCPPCHFTAHTIAPLLCHSHHVSLCCRCC